MSGEMAAERGLQRKTLEGWAGERRHEAGLWMVAGTGRVSSDLREEDAPPAAGVAALTRAHSAGKRPMTTVR